MKLLHLERGRTRCTIVPEAGGRLHQLEIFDGREWLPLLYAPDDPRDALAAPMSSGSFAMVPWPNRIARGQFEFEGERYSLPPNLHGHAIHGFGFDRPWRVESESQDRCRLSLEFDDAWPLGGRAIQEFQLFDDAILQRIELHATICAFPGGAGWHPWFRRDVRGDSGPCVSVPAVETYETHAQIPTGRLLPVAADTDLRAYPPLGERRLDNCCRLLGQPMRIRWGDLELTMEQSPDVRHAVVYTPPHAFCVEPQTCAVDAFNLAARGFDGAGVATVTTDRPLIATTTWRWRIGASA